MGGSARIRKVRLIELALWLAALSVPVSAICWSLPAALSAVRRPRRALQITPNLDSVQRRYPPSPHRKQMHRARRRSFGPRSRPARLTIIPTMPPMRSRMANPVSRARCRPLRVPRRRLAPRHGQRRLFGCFSVEALHHQWTERSRRHDADLSNGLLASVGELSPSDRKPEWGSASRGQQPKSPG